jgi:hypothetical protein
MMVIAAAGVLGVSKREVDSTLDSATEVFARAAKMSDSARGGLQILSEVRVRMRDYGV